MTVPPIDPELIPLHDRAYSVQVYRARADELLARGVVHDEKPPGLYVEDDPDPLTMHRMTLELRVAYPALEITDATVWFGSYPQPACPGIAERYRNLVGLSIARGFTHRVRELFGGPNGCAHVTALLQAMAPAVVQSTWSMRILADREQPGLSSPSGRQSGLGANADTCHVWASDGPLFTAAARGEPVPAPLSVRDRLVELGREPDTWWRGG